MEELTNETIGNGRSQKKCCNRCTGFHSEWYSRSTAKAGDTLGHETVGVVADIGQNVKGFHIGDRVTGLGGGGYKEYIVMEPHKACIVPDNLEDLDAIVEPLACILSTVKKCVPSFAEIL